MMDWASWLSMMNVVLVVAGIAIGLAAGHFASPAVRQAKRLRIQLEQLLQEHETYKSSVNAHFRKTADLVGDMTKSYAAVYNHLAGGARNFCDDAGAGTKVPFGPLPEALASPVIDAATEQAPRDCDFTGHAADVAADPAGVPDDAAEAAVDAASKATTSDS